MSSGSEWPSSAMCSGGLQTPMPQSLCTWSNQVPPCFPMAIQLHGPALCSPGSLLPGAPFCCYSEKNTSLELSPPLRLRVLHPHVVDLPLSQRLGPLLLPQPPHCHWPEWIRRSGVVETVSSCGNPGEMTCECQVQKRGNILASGELEANGLIQCPLPCRPSPEEWWAVCPGAGRAPVCDAARGQVPGAGDRQP